mgnify:CR=1 FL=1
MSFLDRKERIFDLVLTDLGKKQLSTNQLEFVYYAFGDSEINYSGSIDVVLKTTGTLDDHMSRNLSFEADQKKDNLKNQTLKSWLFTMPTDNPVVPEFKLSSTGSITLNRKYRVQNIETVENPFSNLFFAQPVAIISMATVLSEDNASLNHIYSQMFSITKEEEIAPTPTSFLTPHVLVVVAEIKRVQATFATPGAAGAALKALKLLQLKTGYSDLTGGRNYDADLAAGLI